MKTMDELAAARERMLAKAAKERPRTRPLTDLGNAERMIDAHGTDLRHCSDVGRLCWDGQKWALDKTKEWERRAQKTVRALYASASKEPDPNVRKSIADWARKSESQGKLTAMCAVAESLEGVTVTTEQLDADPFALNATNGTVDLRTGKLRSHNPNDLITKVAGAAYDPRATCPTFEAFLRSIFANDEELIGFVQRFVGYSLTGDVREQVLLFCHGGGANGKSTFIDCVIDLLGGFGGYAAPSAPGLLVAKSNEQHPTELADLRGARLVTCVEIGDGKRFDEEKVKSLTGGDRIKARFMRENFFSFSPTHKLILAANHKPQIRGTDLAIWRRILLVPFAVTFTGEQKDPALPQKLRAEMSGVLRWAVEGCLAWQRDGLKPPASVTAATNAYRAEQDAVGRFIADCCALIPSLRAKAGDLYAAYREWCEEQGETEINQRRFGEALAERGLTAVKMTGGVRGWSGIGLSATATNEGSRRWAS